MKELLDKNRKKSVNEIMKENGIIISKTIFTRYAVLKLISTITPEEMSKLKEYVKNNKIVEKSE